MSRRLLTNRLRELVVEAVSAQGWRTGDHAEVVRHVKESGRWLAELIRRSSDETLSLSCGVRAVESGLDPVEAPSGRQEAVVYWRGSVLDLLTDLEPLLTIEQLQELACETVFRWRDRSRRERKSG